MSRIGKHRQPVAPKKTLADLTNASKEARRVSQQTVRDQQVLQDLLNGAKVEDHATLKEYVSSIGTSKQRKQFEGLEREWFGKTSKQMANAEILNNEINHIKQAQTAEELEALKGTFGKMGGSEEIQQALRTQADEIELNRLIREEDLRKAFKVPELGKCQPTASSGLTRAELYKKLYGVEAPVQDVSGVVKAERNAQSIIRANQTITQQAEQIGQQAGTINGLVVENAQQASKIAEQGEKIAEQANTIASQASQMAQKDAKLAKFQKNVKIAIVIAAAGLLVGAGFWAYNKFFKNKNQDVAEVPPQNEDPTAPQKNNNGKVEPAPTDTTQKQDTSVVAQQEENAPEKVPAKITGREDFVRLVKNGDNIWNYVEEELTKLYGHVPTNEETLQGVRKYMQKHNIPLINDYYAFIEPGDSLFSVEG